MPDTKGSMEDILILVIRFAEDQVSAENVEEFLKSKELQTQLNKAFSEIADGLPDHGKFHRSEARERCPVLAVRHALQCSDNLLRRRQRMRDRERCEEGDGERH